MKLNRFTPTRAPTLPPSKTVRAQPRTVENATVSAFEAPRAAAKIAPVIATAVAASPPPPAPARPRGFWDKLKDFASGAATRVADAASSLVTGAVNTVVGVGRNLLESVGTVGSGVGKLFRGDFLGGLKTIGSGLVKGLLQTPADATLMLGGRALSAIQTLVGAEVPGRKLSAEEMAVARQVYGDSIDYSKVRIKAGDVGLFGTTGRAFVHGDTIFVPPASLAPDGSVPNETLAHELGHVWQHQHGGTDYMSEALWAQRFGDGYDWKKGLDAGKSFGQLNPEQQAELISTAYGQGYFENPAAGFSYGGVDYTAQLRAALADIKAGRGAP